MKSEKAAGVCGIPVELLKAGGGSVLRGLAAVFNKTWNICEIPADWRRGVIIPIFNGKGDRRKCGGHRGVNLLSAPGKLFAKILLGRIRNHLLAHQRPEQSGVTPKNQQSTES